MTYRMESAKPAHLTWGYKLDYDAEIAADERRVAYLSSDFVKAVAVAVDAMLAEGQEWALGCGADSLFFVRPELAALAGFSADDMRAMFSTCCDWTDEAQRIVDARYGPAQAGDYVRGQRLWESSTPNGTTWMNWRALGESGKGGRVDLLKKAKASLSRHKRNKEKYG